MKDFSKIKTFDELIDLEYGKTGTDRRYEFENNSKFFIDCEMKKDAECEANQLPKQMPTNSLNSIEVSPLVKSLSDKHKLVKDFDF